MSISKTIKECAALADKVVIPQVRAKITAVNKYLKSQPGEAVPWTLQEIFLEDETGSIMVKVANQAEIPATMVGQTVALIASRKQATNQLIGVRMATIQVESEGGIRSERIIEVTKAGQIVRVEPEPEVANETNADEGPAVIPEKTQSGGLNEASIVTQPPSSPVVSETQKTAKPAPGFTIIEVRYDRTVNTGNYCSAKVGATAQVDPGYKASEALKTLKAFVEAHCPKEAAK